MDLDILNNTVAELFATAEQQGLLGMQEVCMLVQQNIVLLTEQLDQLEQITQKDTTPITTPINWDLLGCFVPLAYAYLEPTADAETVDLLLDCLSADAWPMPLSADVRESLHEILLADRSLPMPAMPEPEVLVEVREQSIDQELIDMLAGEITRLCPELENLLTIIGCANSEPTEESMEAIATYIELVERMSMASDAVGLPALKTWFDILHGYIAANGGLGFSAEQQKALSLMPTAILAYLASPLEPTTAESLLGILRGEIWGAVALSTSYVHSLQQALSMVRITKESESIPARQTKALPEDVSLAIPSDLNQELLDGLLQELPIQTGDFSTAIQHIATGHGTLKDIDAAKRAAHTLKGAANTVGIKGIANLTHHVEDIFVALSKHQVLPSRSMAQMLVHAGDCLEAMSEAVTNSSAAPDDAINVLQEVLNWANRIDQDGIPDDDTPIEPVVVPVEEAVVPSTSTSSTQASTPTEAMVRVPANLIDELLRLVGETIISTGQVQERLQRLERQNKAIQAQNKTFLQLAAKLEEQVDIHGSVGSWSIRQNQEDSDFDPLEFEHYSELHTISRQLIEVATDSSEFSSEVKNELDKLGEVVGVQNRLHDETQNAMMRLRMLPVSTIVSRLQRSVRQTSRLVDKEITLEVLGAETMVDANILNELVDPLMHILRNSIDHGIESAEKRAALGKSKEGRITLRFSREGNQIVIRCRDDGAGIDLDAVRRKAQDNGLIAAGLTLSDDELARLILTPGFSTRNEPTQVSGRGVGMDVVYSRVLQLKGGLSLQSERGKGLEIELSMPATLISTHALLVIAQTKVFAISSYGIQDIRFVTHNELQRVGPKNFLRIGNDLLPLLHLDKLLNLPHSDRIVENEGVGFPALLVKDDVGSVNAVQVQEIVDSRNLVVKNLGRFVPKPHGVVGATILGDGSVAAVIDIPELMRKPTRQLKSIVPSLYDVQGNAANSTKANLPSQRTAMVVDDSLSARRATVQFMKDAGFEVRSAIDGIEAIAILAKWKPQLMLVDMEMPRMNGLELTAHIRAQPDMANIPIIMITSRSTEKHRSQAKSAGVNAYLTKPFGEDELLQHVTALTGS